MALTVDDLEHDLNRLKDEVRSAEYNLTNQADNWPFSKPTLGPQ